MYTKRVRTNTTWNAGWAVLLIYAVYAMALYIFALTLTSVSLVA